MKVLQLTAHYAPNIGGVETHLSDLVEGLASKANEVFVLTYQPLTVKKPWKIFEKSKNIQILRIPWFAGLFYSLVHLPILEFLYLLPGLFIVTPLVLVYFDPEVIHAHGLVAGAVGVVWGKLFGKRVVISLHSIYSFPKTGLYRDFVTWIFKLADKVIGLSLQSEREIRSLGVNNAGHFTYWIDMNKFSPQKVEINKFNVLFVGRLVKEKGVFELNDAAKELKKSGVVVRVAGLGPESDKLNNCEILGAVSQDDLPKIYSSASLLIVPSVHEEGFGRVVIEALACGIPVIASNRGALPEAIDDTVGRLIEVTKENIVKAVLELKNNKTIYTKLKSNARKFALMRYSIGNIVDIANQYSNI